MSTNPNQQPNDAYNGGYGGYSPANSADDPYGSAQAQRGASQQNDPNYTYGQQQQQQQQQQYGQQQSTYVPPSSVNRNRRGTYSGATQGPSQGSADSNSRLRALLSYLGLCFTGIFFLLRDRKNSYVRYHAAQSVVVFGPLVIVYVALSILSGVFGLIPLLGGIIITLFGIVLGLLNFVIVVLWLVLMVTSYLGMNIRIPVVSEYTDRLVARFAR